MSSYLNGIKNENESNISNIDVPCHVFFSGASWGCAFHIGVLRAMQQKWGLNKLSKCKFAGNSSGALIALCAAIGMDWKEAEKNYLHCLNGAINNGVFGKMSIYHNHCFDECLQHGEIYKKVNGKLFVGVTYFMDKYELISHWNSNEELRDCIHASMHIPYYCTHLALTNNKRAIDGGFGRMFHRFNRQTLVITVLSTKGDVAPNPLFTFGDCYSANLEKYYKMRDEGSKMMNEWNMTYKWKEYDLYTKSKWRLKKNANKLNLRISKKKMVAFTFWMLRILEEIKIKRIVIFIIILFIYKKYRSKYRF